MDYVFDKPVVLDHPGLVSVAHQREGNSDAAWLFDESTTKPDGSCGQWSDCHSSMTLPDLKQGNSGGQAFWAWNGLSFPFQHDFVVRLYVEYTDDVTPAEGLFQPMEPLVTPNRQSVRRAMPVSASPRHTRCPTWATSIRTAPWTW